MANPVLTQLATFWQAALLGAVWGAGYDLLRSLRLRRPRSRLLTHTLDALYAAAVLLGSFLFALRCGGEFRLYMLLAMLAGGVVYFQLLCALFRPLWDFWAGTLALFLSLLCRPMGAALRLWKKLLIYIKKLFLFLCKCVTIGK